MLLLCYPILPSHHHMLGRGRCSPGAPFNGYFSVEVRKGASKNVLHKPVCKSLFSCDDAPAEGVCLRMMHHFLHMLLFTTLKAVFDSREATALLKYLPRCPSELFNAAELFFFSVCLPKACLHPARRSCDTP